MPKIVEEMDEECQPVLTSEPSQHVPFNASSSSAATFLTDVHSEIELPKIMASLGLDEDVASSCSDEFPSNAVRRSRRKPLVHSYFSGGVSKRRCTLKQARKDAKFHDSDEDIKDFYQSYNDKFKVQETKSLETIYEEPKEKNGKVVLLGPKRKRFNAYSGFVSVAKLKKRQSNIKLLLLGRGKETERKHFSIEDVKDHLAESGSEICQFSDP